MYLQGQRNNALGTRGRLSTDYLNRGIAPYQTITDLQAGDLANVGRIGQLEDSNTLYDYTRPEDAIRRRVGLLEDLDTLKTGWNI
jgi:hypothetical protein